MQSPNPIQCPHCGSTDIRLSSRQSERRPIDRYRCRKCKRHFEKDAPHSGLIKTGTVVGVLLVASVVVTVAVIVAGGVAQKPPGEATIPSIQLERKPPPAAGNDAASQYNRAFHLWALGDYREAFPWFRSAAEKGHREARYYLGLSHLYGRGTVQNYRLAFEQMQASAHQGHLEAQYELGLLYRDGHGVNANRELAYAWWNIASSHGHEGATHERDKIAAVMSPEQITQAQEVTMKELTALMTPGTPSTQGKQTP